MLVACTFRRAMLAAGAALAVASCIPEDTTTQRGGVAVNFEPSELLQRGAEFTTADGWRVVLEKTILSIEALPGEGCNYKEADFGGVVYDARNAFTSVIRGAEARECKYFVSLRGGLPYARVGPGASVRDQALLASAVDAFDIPYAVRFEGSASFGTEKIRFNFGVAASGIFIKFSTIIPADNKVDTTFRVSPEEIFRATSSGRSGPLLFTPVWLADQRGNHDGIVTNDELDRMRVSRSGGLTPGSDIALSDFFTLKTRSIFELRSANVGEPKPGNEP